ncbi:hypothetical protein SPRG_19909 [Saprolegnia parasitica CBS 223.65]|uniref:FYVE-type domain-containing protein n=1 Tax=Saprolegnia parasitica (strain CBS 223.65) TaxID=695850 RepID=A0A067CFJ3_SAPPC|nr:hypothetical protein SPRG_19909 [Saprolegnia parasitica CBS 223.65]KDO29243.1 hypothetical protein SPRG_19909 [Saprolegnia parasitica CBS 223.65]|eukprot:XP_012200136.1 hypothetical protein SPRG_19909 [Saprolegnia parasitica CBS 223.65]
MSNAGNASVLHVGPMVTGKEEKEKIIFKRRLDALGLKGLPRHITAQMQHVAVAKADALVRLASSNPMTASSASSSKPLMKTAWNYVKDKNGVMLYEGLAETGEYMVKATVNASSSVANAVAQLRLDSTELLNQTLNALGKPAFYTGDHILSVNCDPLPPLHLAWMAWSTEGVEIKDFVFMAHAQLFASPANQAMPRIGTMVWESVDVVAAKYPNATRSLFKHTGIVVTASDDADDENCQISLVFCLDKHTKRLKWMQAFALNFVASLRTASAARVAVATTADFGDEMHCGVCLKTFGLFRRRHHCRMCAHAICTQCSTTVMLDQVGEKGRKGVRACLHCASRPKQHRVVRSHVQSDDTTSPRSVHSQLVSPESEFSHLSSVNNNNSSSSSGNLRATANMSASSNGPLPRKASDQSLFGTDRGHRAVTANSATSSNNSSSNPGLRESTRLPARRMSGGVSNPSLSSLSTTATSTLHSQSGSYQNVLDALEPEPSLSRHPSAPRIAPPPPLSRQSSGQRSEASFSRHGSIPRLVPKPRSEVGVARAPRRPHSSTRVNKAPAPVVRERVGQHMIQLIEDEGGMIKLVNPLNMFNEHAEMDAIDSLIAPPPPSDLIPLLEENLSGDTLATLGSRPSDLAFRPTFISVTSDTEF